LTSPPPSKNGGREREFISQKKEENAATRFDCGMLGSTYIIGACAKLKSPLASSAPGTLRRGEGGCNVGGTKGKNSGGGRKAGGSIEIGILTEWKMGAVGQGKK